LSRLLEQLFGPSEEGSGHPGAGEDFKAQVSRMQVLALKIVGQSPGIQMGGIASALGVDINYAQAIVRPLVAEAQLVVDGWRPGPRSSLPADAPSVEPDDIDQDAPAEGERRP